MRRGIGLVLALCVGCFGSNAGEDGTGAGDGGPGATAGGGAGARAAGARDGAVATSARDAATGTGDAGGASLRDGNFANPTRDGGGLRPDGGGLRPDGGGIFVPPDPDCGSLRLDADVGTVTRPGNVLVVFDVSPSMRDAWGASSKLDAASGALQAAITPLQDQLEVGAIFFPTAGCIPLSAPPPGGAVQPIDGSAQLRFLSGRDFLSAWSRALTATQTVSLLGTPLTEAMQRADAALASRSGVSAVVLFTDGAPNCYPGDGAGIAGLEASLATAWAAAGTRTYVIGLPGAAGVLLLDEIAAAGGTTQHLAPESATALEQQLSTIASETVVTRFDSCSILIDPAADDPDQLHVVVSSSGAMLDVPRDLGGGAGWSVSSDGAQVQLLGAFCEAAQSGAYDSIYFEYGCVDLPPLPPF